MEPTHTLSDEDADSQERGTFHYLVLAFDCARPLTPPSRLVLDTAEVIIGRGARREWTREPNGVLRLMLPDAGISSTHARLSLERDRFILEDRGSKNGTLLNGARVERVPLSDRDVVEVGNTSLVFRTLAHARRAGDQTASGNALPNLPRTLHAPWSFELSTLLRVARTTAPVLLLGETGTGKEVLARAVHAASGRSGPFVPVNCAAIVRTLIESELFGVKRGAFSGAGEDRAGLVRSAHGGTLFLDEIAELPEPAQAALLRVLQEQEVLPVGATRAVPVDLRVVAATHQELPPRVADGRFRADLHSRLIGHVVHLPPLRERLEDLGVLIAELLVKLAGERASRVRFARAAGRALFTYAWTYNVRELEQTLRAALAIAAVDEIGVADLPERVRDGATPPAASSAPVVAEDVDPDAAERARIQAALDGCAGNQTRAARALGVSRATLVKKLAIHRMPRPRKPSR
jgi:DNA-binding NtrC family response regulator